MDYRLTLFFCVLAIALVAAVPFNDMFGLREKRDVMDSMKNAWGEMVKTLSDAGDAVVHVFKPTEKSTVDKVADSIVHVFKPTEKSVVDKMADGIKSLTQ